MRVKTEDSDSNRLYLSHAAKVIVVDVISSAGYACLLDH
jgi:hypothetical protein